MALALGEQRDEHIGAVHILATGGLHADDGALHDALETGGRLAVACRFIDQIVQFAVDVVAQILAEQIEIDRAGAQDRGRVGVVDEAQQKMLERRIFMVALSRRSERAIE